MSDTNSDSNMGDGNSGSIGATAYYGGIAVALCVIIALTLFSRFVYKRRMKRRLTQANRAERRTLQERGEAPGLPTYNESRRGPSLPMYTLDYQSGHDADQQQPPNQPSGSPPPLSRSPNSENHFHFNFPPFSNMPSLPQALHLRPQRANDVEAQMPQQQPHDIPSQPPPAYKYEPPAGPPPGVAPAAPDSQQHDEGVPSEMHQRRAEEGTGLGPPVLSTPAGSPGLDDVPPPLSSTATTTAAAAGADATEMSSEERERQQQEELDREERQRQDAAQQDLDNNTFIHPEERRRMESNSSPDQR